MLAPTNHLQYCSILEYFCCIYNNGANIFVWPWHDYMQTVCKQQTHGENLIGLTNVQQTWTCNTHNVD